MKMKQTGNNTMLYFYKNETAVVPKKSLEKLEIFIAKGEAAGIFRYGKDDVFGRNIRQGFLPDDTWKKNFRMPKIDFEALNAGLRPFISPNFYLLITEL